jgi:hypothetical protein
MTATFNCMALAPLSTGKRGKLLQRYGCVKKKRCRPRSRGVRWPAGVALGDAGAFNPTTARRVLGGEWPGVGSAVRVVVGLSRPSGCVCYRLLRLLAPGMPGGGFAKAGKQYWRSSSCSRSGPFGGCLLVFHWRCVVQHRLWFLLLPSNPLHFPLLDRGANAMQLKAANEAKTSTSRTRGLYFCG